MTPDAERMAGRLTGVLTALVTPFTTTGELDLLALDDHVDAQAAAGTPVVAVGGSIGEYASLTLRERRELAERVVRAAAGRVAVLVGVTHQRPPAVRELAEHAAAIGADGLLVCAPPQVKLDDGELREFWTWLAGTVTLPWVLYAAADTTSGPPPLDLLDELAGLRLIAGYKDPSPDIGRLRDVLALLRGRLPVVAAAEPILPAALAAGAPACMTATACFAPEQLQRLHRAVEVEDTEAAAAAFTPILAFRAHFQARMDAGFPVYIPYTKAACDLTGLRSGPPRPPLRPVPDGERARLAGTLHDHGLARRTEAVARRTEAQRR